MRKVSKAIESGSNDNGEYIKFPDGTLICFNYRAFNNLNCTIAYGSIYFDNIQHSWIYPYQFVSAPKVTLTAYFNGGIGSANISAPIENTIVRYYVVSMIKYTFGFAGVECFAIGRWK